MSKELGKALQQLRKRSELTQKQVADVLHIDRSTYAYYEGGTTEPDLKSINKLAKIFNVPPACLLPDNDGSVNVSLCDVTDGVDTGFFIKEGALDPKDEKIYSLSKEERSFVVWLRTLSPAQKAKLKSLLDEDE